MATEQVNLDEIKVKWDKEVRGIQRMAQAAAGSTLAHGGLGVSRPLNQANSLAFMNACSTFGDVLKKLGFKGRMLGTLLNNSKDHMDWINYELICNGNQLRTEVAHDCEIPERSETWEYINAIEDQLVAWGVLEPWERNAFPTPPDKMA